MLRGVTANEPCLHGDEAGGVGVVIRPALGKPSEVVLGDDVGGTTGSGVESVQDDADEEVHEHKRDRQGETERRTRVGRDAPEGGGVDKNQTS